ncbi:hypothetical protein KI387_040014, partial [Taxus chinensis]
MIGFLEIFLVVDLSTCARDRDSQLPKYSFVDDKNTDVYQIFIMYGVADVLDDVAEFGTADMRELRVW